ncbi:MAG: ribonuclease HII [Clostridia bacterium]|nr:ribonuclease HII [Clostridia bacterium]
MLNKTTPDETFENQLREAGYTAICGVDEAGRGPLSGPVVAAACILPAGCEIPGLNDSKKLTPKQRDRLFDTVREVAIAYAIGMASPEEIDQLNILNATMLAMRRAIEGLPVKADFALIDGNCARGIDLPHKTVISGDALSVSISAASILAKVTRDRICLENDRDYPEYGFAKHKGYGTREHMDALRRLGPCPLHRRSFLKFLNEDETK